jgi:hypothetical protein
MPTPLGLAALEALRARLRAIRKDDQYNTDAGKNVYLGPVSLSGDGIDEAVVLEFGDETAQGDSGSGAHTSITIQRTFTVTGVVRADPKCEKGEALERILADIKRAVFRKDARYLDMNGKRFSGLAYQSAKIVQRADGNEFEGVEVTGTVTYQEGYGDPYTSR